MDGVLRVLHVIPHKTAVDEGFHHLRIFLQGTGEIIYRLLEQLVLAMYMSGQQGEIRLFRQSVFILSGQRENVIVAAQVIKAVAEINGGITISRELLNGLFSQPSRFSIATL